ncbi:MAG: RNA polymerase sigma factor [Bacteroidota bacterium]
MRIHSNSTDQALRRACQAGDRRACAPLYERYFGKMLGITMRYSRDRDTAVSILNQAFLRIFESLDQYEERGSFAGWMRTIVFRTAMNHIRFEQRHQPPLVNIEETVPPAIENSIEADLAAEVIFEQIQALPDHLRTVFSLHAIDGHTHAEIASLLDISESNSRWRLAKAREILRAALGPYYERNGKTA